MLDGIYQSLVVFYAAYFIYIDSALAQGYGSDDKYLISNAVAIYAIVLVNIYVGLNIHNWTLIVWVIILFSCASPFIFVPIYGLMPSEVQGSFKLLFGNWVFWFGLAWTLAAGLIPGHVCKYLRAYYWPTDNDIARELQWAKIPPPAYEPPHVPFEPSSVDFHPPLPIVQAPPAAALEMSMIPKIQIDGTSPTAESWYQPITEQPVATESSVAAAPSPTAAVSAASAISGSEEVASIERPPSPTKSLPRPNLTLSRDTMRARSVSPKRLQHRSTWTGSSVVSVQTRTSLDAASEASLSLRRKSYIYDVSAVGSPVDPLSVHTGFAFSSEDKLHQ